MRELATRTGLAWGSKELFLRATAKADPLEGEVFDPAMLFTGAGFTGNALGVAYPGVPNLGWFFGMNNAVSSVQVLVLSPCSISHISAAPLASWLARLTSR